MPFTVDYGPISTAMNLAVGAGQAQRQQIGFGEDMQALGYLQHAQQMSQQQKATEIQQSLQGQQLGIEEQRNQATNQLAQAQMQATSNYHQGLLGNQANRNANTADYQQGRVGALQQNADTNSYRADNMDAYRQMMAGIAQQNSGIRQQVADQQGQKIAQGPNQERNLQDYYNSLATQARSMESNASKNFADPKTDPQYQAVVQKMKEIEGNIRDRLLNPQGRQPPPVNPNETQQIAQQGGIPTQLQNTTPDQSPVTLTPQGQQPAPQQAPPQSGRTGLGPLTPGSMITSQSAVKYLAAVGGDPHDPATQAKARQLAAQDGWSLPGMPQQPQQQGYSYSSGGNVQ